jgi:hypothetical protein
MPTDTIVWEEVRRVYDDHSIPIAKICLQFGITKPQLTTTRNALGWTPRLGATDPRRQLDKLVPDTAAEDLDTADTTPSAARAKRSRSKRPPPLAERRERVARLTAVIDTKIAILERRFARELENTKRKKKSRKAGLLAGAAGTTSVTDEKDNEGTFVSAAESERDQRAISLIIKNLELIREYGNAPQPGPHLRGAAAKSASLAATQLADEADRARRQLGDRLSRLIETTAGAAPSDPASA